MAVTPALVANSATPHSVMISVTGDATGAVLIPRATLLGYMAEGPLKAFLRGLPTTAWGTCNITGTCGSKIRIYDVAMSLTDTVEYRLAPYQITWVANADPALTGLSVNVGASQLEAVASVRTFEIRFNHSDPA